MRVKIMAEMLSEAQKKADRQRADPFYQQDGQRPSTSGTQRRSASSSSSHSAAPSRSGPPPPVITKRRRSVVSRRKKRVERWAGSNSSHR